MTRPASNSIQVPDENWYQDSIAQLIKQFPEEAPGFFGPGSMTWRIYREPGILIGSYRALLLQVAHPAVGAGVAFYSNFQKDYLGRAYRTFFNMSSIFFGSRKEALRVAGQLHRMHYRIKGQYRNAQGQSIAYCANQPELLCWILATLVDTSIRSYEHLHGPLSAADKEIFFQESQITAQLMGIPLSSYPESYEDFCHYFQQMLQSKVLAVGATGLDLSEAILRGPFFWGSSIIRLFATGLLPASLRQAYRLPWTERQEKRLQTYLKRIRGFYRFFPVAWRTAPPFYQAQYRVARAAGRRLGGWAWFFHHLGRYIKAPFLITS